MLIGLVGRKQSGKDTAADYLIQHHDFTRVAFADKLRAAAYDLNPIIAYTDAFLARGGTSRRLQAVVDTVGWDRAKEDFPEVRRTLQRLATEVARTHFGQDIWCDLAWKEISPLLDAGKHVVVTDVRFRNEIQSIKYNYGKLWRIVREDLPAEDPNDPLMQHVSEKDWRDTIPDAVIVNPGKVEGGLEQYQENVERAWANDA